MHPTLKTGKCVLLKKNEGPCCTFLLVGVFQIVPILHMDEAAEH